MRRSPPTPPNRPVAPSLTAAGLVLALLAAASPVCGYPLDGAGRTGIRRLDGYLAAQQAPGARRLPPGALLGTGDITLNLLANPTWDLAGADKDPVLQAALESIFKGRDPSYGVAVVDITDPDDIVWAGVRESRTQLPGSVGKVLCMIGLFDGLRRRFPAVEDRERFLRERLIAANDWATGDPHTVPRFDPATGVNRFSVVVPGDRFTLSE